MYLERLESTHEVKSCLEMLKTKLPRSFYLVELFRQFIEFGVGDFEVFRIKASRDSEASTAVLSVCEDNVGSFWKYSVYFDEKDSNLVIEALRDRIDWSKLNAFVSLPVHQRPMLETLYSISNTKTQSDVKCCTMALQNVDQLPDPLPAAEHIVKRIPPELAKVINTNWKFRGPNTEAMIHYELETKVGFGAFVDGQMVSWVVLSKFGPLTHLHTVPEARGHGYASMVVNRLCRYLLNLDIIPFADVEVDNTVARKLFEKLGFTTQCASSFLTCGP